MGSKQKESTPQTAAPTPTDDDSMMPWEANTDAAKYPTSEPPEWNRATVSQGIADELASLVGDRLVVKSHEQVRYEQALQADMEAIAVLKQQSEAPGGGRYKVPIMDPDFNLLGYEWRDGNGNRVAPPEGER